MANDQEKLTVSSLKAIGVEPHWFGLGFVQLKLDEHRRIHFWHPDHSSDTPEEEVHNHRYDFNSRIMAGIIVHEVWDFTPATTRCSRSPASLAHQPIRLLLQQGAFLLPETTAWRLDLTTFSPPDASIAPLPRKARSHS
jgi:hypothetical protein